MEKCDNGNLHYAAPKGHLVSHANTEPLSRRAHCSRCAVLTNQVLTWNLAASPNDGYHLTVGFECTHCEKLDDLCRFYNPFDPDIDEIISRRLLHPRFHTNNVTPDDLRKVLKDWMSSTRYETGDHPRSWAMIKRRCRDLGLDHAVVWDLLRFCPVGREEDLFASVPRLVPQ